MAEQKELNTAWLAQLPNPHHDGTTQQIDDFVRNFETDNAKVLEKVAALIPRPTRRPTQRRPPTRAAARTTSPAATTTKRRLRSSQVSAP